MTLNRTELKKIIYDFNSISNRLLQANFDDYNGVLDRFVRFLNEKEIIHDYIAGCGNCEQDMATEFKEVQTGQAIFSLGDSDEEEVRTVYSILSYIVDHNVNVYYGIGMSYSHSNHFQEILKDFNDRVTMVLIRHIEAYLTKVGIDMGLDDKKVFNVSVQNGQAIIATDNATVTATNTVGLDQDKLAELIAAVRDAAVGLSEEDAEAVEESLDVVATEAASDKPKKSFLRTALKTLNGIKGVAEFSAAVATLIQFVQTLL